MPLVLPNLSLVGILTCVDLYRISRYERMDALSLAIRLVIKAFTINMLRDCTGTSCALVTANTARRSFSAIEKTVLAMLNAFTQKTDK